MKGDTLMELEEARILKDDVKIGYIDKEKIRKKYIYFFIKKVIDFLGSMIGLIILMPVYVIISILIKIEDPKGKIIFSQTRIGKNGKKFKMYKFRSMCVDAEEKLIDLLEKNEVEGAMFKLKEDPRVTKIGKFIRKTSLDELPQLWNVLVGDMSLVGPRPPLEREVAEYTYYDKQRLLVTPGCTGLWQVSGRNNVGFNEMVELDIDYIKHLSIYNDFKILMKTILVIALPNGAY